MRSWQSTIWCASCVLLVATGNTASAQTGNPTQRGALPRYEWQGTIQLRVTGGKRVEGPSGYSEWRYDWSAEYRPRMAEQPVGELPAGFDESLLPYWDLAPQSLQYIVHADTAHNSDGGGGRNFIYVRGTAERELDAAGLYRGPEHWAGGPPRSRLFGRVTRGVAPAGTPSRHAWATGYERGRYWSQQAATPGFYYVQVLLYPGGPWDVWSKADAQAAYQGIDVTFGGRIVSQPPPELINNRGSSAALVAGVEVFGFLTQPDQQEVHGTHTYQTESNNCRWTVTWNLERKPMDKIGRG